MQIFCLLLLKGYTSAAALERKFMKAIIKMIDLIEKAMAAQKEIIVIDKSGKFNRGILYDHYVRLSADKLRGKVKLRLTQDQSEIEVDVNDILDIQV